MITYLSGFTRRLSELGWTDGRNLRMDVRWAAGSVDRARIYALVNVQPDVMVANSTPVTAALQRETRTTPRGRRSIAADNASEDHCPGAGVVTLVPTSRMPGLVTPLAKSCCPAKSSVALVCGLNATAFRWTR